MITTTQNVKAQTRTQNPPTGEPREIPLDAIQFHPLNPRETIDKQEIERLSSSLEHDGLLQRVIVRRAAGGRFQLIAGSRRYHAAKLAHWSTLPCEVRDVSDAEAAQYLVVENLLRRNLNPIERAKAIQLLLTPADEGGAGRSTKEVAAMLGHTHKYVLKLCSLLKLPEPWRSRVAEGKIDRNSGIALAIYADQPQVLAAIDDDLRRSPELWEGARLFAKRVVLIAESRGVLTRRARRAQLVERAKGSAGVARSLRQIADHFQVNHKLVRYWQKAGAPIISKPYDLAAIAAWLQQRQEHDNAEPTRRGSRPTVLAPTRHAPAVKVFDDGFKPAPAMRAKPQNLTEAQAIELLVPYMYSMGDLQMILAHVQAMIADLKRESK